MTAGRCRDTSSDAVWKQSRQPLFDRYASGHRLIVSREPPSLFFIY
jgi:hypothetical protein